MVRFGGTLGNPVHNLDGSIKAGVGVQDEGRGCWVVCFAGAGAGCGDHLFSWQWLGCGWFSLLGDFEAGLRQGLAQNFCYRGRGWVGVVVGRWLLGSLFGFLT